MRISNVYILGETCPNPPLVQGVDINIYKAKLLYSPTQGVSITLTSMLTHKAPFRRPGLIGHKRNEVNISEEMNGPQRTAVSRKDLWQIRKQKGF